MPIVLVKGLMFGKDFHNRVIIKPEQIYLGFDFRTDSEKDDPIKLLDTVGVIRSVYDSHFELIEELIKPDA
jgi:hypothetical protein